MKKYTHNHSGTVVTVVGQFMYRDQLTGKKLYAYETVAEGGGKAQVDQGNFMRNHTIIK